MVSREILDAIALTEKEYELVVRKLGREPNRVELEMFGALWSEHCGYKHSKALLKMFPSRGKYVRIPPGVENAGAVSIGDGLVIVMKMESHNHPSAIEPFQGAATGVGGIVRDIFTMGAWPMALTNSLRFGPLDEPRNRYLFGGVVGGIASYGNCLGIPDVCGEIYFSSSYSGNPLVNAMCVGIIEEKYLTRASASGAENLVMLVGADTGRDGIHGASGLASRTFEDERELRPTVQVGNPFLEKLLIEACIELTKTDWIVGMQDLGAAGLTSASVESAYKGGCGIEIDVAKIPRREEGMTPYEVMLSESQERMLVIVKKGYEGKVKQLFDHWDLHSDIIGVVTETGRAVIKDGQEVVADMPVKYLSEPPVYVKKVRKPAWLTGLQKQKVSLNNIKVSDYNEVTLKLLASPNIASKEFVYRQYDHQVQTNTVVRPGDNAGVLRIKGTQKAIALTNDGNGRLCYLDPYRGGQIVISEAARNLVCSGARPIALTNCLNFGNPEKDDIYYQLKEAIRGMAHACRILGVPVISGNVSLYNETRNEAIYPTPVVGMLGLIDDVNRHCTGAFKNEGDAVFLLGNLIPENGQAALAGSEFMELFQGKVAGRPAINLALEKRIQKFCLQLIRKGLLQSAHDCSEGGLIIALAESCIKGNTGFKSLRLPLGGKAVPVLFGEEQSRIVISVKQENAKKLEGLAAVINVPLTCLGTVGGDKLVINKLINLSIEQIKDRWQNGLARALSS